MDEGLLKDIGISSATYIVFLCIWKLIGYLNNKRIHSSCNGHNLDVVVAVNNATDEDIKPSPKPSPKIHPLSESPSIDKLHLEK